jgi:TonB family protein
MKNLVITLAFALSLSFSGNIFGQSTTESPKDTVSKTPNSSEYFELVDVLPEFMGGEEARIKFLRENVKYPASALEKGIQGTVYLSFVVEKDGSISNVKVVRGVSKVLDKEAKRVISMMPKWKPGMQEGKPVRVLFNMPIKFTAKKNTIVSPKDQKVDEKAEMIIPNNVQKDDTIEGEGIFVSVEVPAEFPGGEEARFKFLIQNINYPLAAKERNEQGTVWVKFVIEKDGSISNATIVRGVSPLLDAEALRVVHRMPKWKPATQKGKEVRVWYNMPFKFSLQG